MDVLALPKKLGALQYRALVLPYRLVRPTYLADESALRLRYERVLGALDVAVGGFLDDESLTRRGEALRKRADLVEQAEALDNKAAQHATDAARTREEGLNEVERQRRAAAAEAENAVRQAREDEQADKARIARETDERERAEKARIEAEAQARVQAAEAAAQAAKDRIAEAEAAVTAAPKAQVQEAVAQKRTAAQDKRKADVLGDLAAEKRAERKQS